MTEQERRASANGLRAKTYKPTEQNEELPLTPKEIDDLNDQIEASKEFQDLPDDQVTQYVGLKHCEAQLAKVLKHRLNRPKLRKKIARWFHRNHMQWCAYSWEGMPELQRQHFLLKADRILDLIPEAGAVNERIRIANKIEADMPSITRYGALQYVRDLCQDLKRKEAENG